MVEGELLNVWNLHVPIAGFFLSVVRIPMRRSKRRRIAPSASLPNCDFRDCIQRGFASDLSCSSEDCMNAFHRDCCYSFLKRDTDPDHNLMCYLCCVAMNKEKLDKDKDDKENENEEDDNNEGEDEDKDEVEVKDKDEDKKKDNDTDTERQTGIFIIHEPLLPGTSVQSCGHECTMWTQVERNRGPSSHRWLPMSLFSTVDVVIPKDIGKCFDSDRWVLVSIFAPLDGSDIRIGVANGGGPYQTTDFFWTSPLSLRPCKKPWVSFNGDQSKWVRALWGMLDVADEPQVNLVDACRDRLTDTHTGVSDLTRYTCRQLRSFCRQLGVTTEAHSLNKAGLIELLGSMSFVPEELDATSARRSPRSDRKKPTRFDPGDSAAEEKSGVSVCFLTT